MQITASQLQSILPKVKGDDVVRLYADGQCLESVLVGTDYRVRRSVPLPGGQMGPVYVVSGPLSKAASVRADDIPVTLEDKGETLVLSHGEFNLTLDKVTGKTFNMPTPEPNQPTATKGLVAAFKKVTAIVGSDDHKGVLFSWSGGTVTLLAVSGCAQAHGAAWPCSEGSGRVAMSVAAAEQICKLGEVSRWWLQDGALFLEAEGTTIRISKIRDAYPASVWEGVFGAPAITPASCVFDVDELSYALKATSAGLSKGDIGVTLKTVGATEDSVVWEVAGRASRGKRSARERVVARTRDPMSVSMKIDVSRLLTSLGEMHGSVAVQVSTNSMTLDDGVLKAALTALV